VVAREMGKGERDGRERASATMFRDSGRWEKVVVN
jgi:hypothetical protein